MINCVPHSFPLPSKGEVNKGKTINELNLNVEDLFSFNSVLIKCYRN